MRVRLFAIFVVLMGVGLLALVAWMISLRSGLAIGPPEPSSSFMSPWFVLTVATALVVLGIQLLRRRRWSLVAIASIGLLFVALDVYLVWSKWAHFGPDAADLGGLLIPVFVVCSSVALYFRWPHGQRN